MIPLQAFIDQLSAFIDDNLTLDEPAAGTIRPYLAAEVPAVTLSMTGLNCTTLGVGGTPGNRVCGVMPLELTLDLANPVVTFPGNEAVNLVSEDRTRVQIPHHPLVDTSGATPEYLGETDIRAILDTVALSVTSETPGPGQVRLEGNTGTMAFGTALGNSGTLEILYHIGQWEAVTVRCSGLLQVEVYQKGNTETEALSNEVAGVLSQNPGNIMAGLTRFSPVAWGPVEKPSRPRGSAMRRTLSYSFIFDHEQPVLSTGGGPIRVIDVRSGMGPERFLIK